MAVTRPSAFLGAGRLLGDYGRIAVMGLVLAAVLFTFFFVFSEPRDERDLGRRRAIQAPTASVVVPEIDPAILAGVRDATPTERLMLDEEPFRHLLEKSANVGPAQARALGMPPEPVPIDRIRDDVDSWRGKYLYYRGTLKYRAPARDGHPLDGLKIQEGALETEDGDVVLFAVARELPPQIALGSWIEVQGFLLGLRDSNILVETRKAPMLVGPRVTPSMRPWPPVTELDPEILSTIPVGTADPIKGWSESDLAAMRRQLEDGQSRGLWHLASYAQHRAQETTLEDWRKVPAFNTTEQLAAAKEGEIEPGTPMRILGEFVFGRWIPAETNPIGEEAWSEAWIQVRDLGSKPIPVWVPGRLQGVRRRDAMEIRGYYLRNLAYDTQDGERFTPLFVAAELDQYRVVRNPIVRLTGWVFVGLVAAVMALFFFVSKADGRRRRLHEERMAKKRRGQFSRGLQGAQA